MEHHGHHETDSYQMENSRYVKGRGVAIFLVLISWAALAAGYYTDQARAFQSYLWAFCFGTFICITAAFFTFIQYLTGSAWSVTVRRFMENLMVSLAVGVILFIPICFGLHSLYEWSHTDVVMKDSLLMAKRAFLNEKGFMIRGGVMFLLWSIWGLAVWGQSTKQDKAKSARQMKISARWAAPGLLVVMLSGCLAAFDWIMSLDPHWYSTIFGLYVMSGAAAAMMAVVTLIAMGFRSAGMLRNSITGEHFHDLGKWMFALSVFWAYMAASQYLLIWYANIPEETIWYQHRMHGNWKWVSLMLPIGRFIVPFGLLVGRAAKRSQTALKIAAVWTILMELMDLYWMIMPSFQKDGFELSWIDLAALAAVVSFYGLFFWSRFRRHSMVVEGDLRFEQGLNFHQA